MNKHLALRLSCLGIAVVAGCSSKSKAPFADVPSSSLAQITPIPAASPADAAPALPLPELSAPLAPTTLPLAQTLVIKIDEKGNMTRDFATSTLPTQDGDVIAGPTYWPDLNKSQKRSDLENFCFEPFEFVLSTVLLPARAVITPPWERVVYTPVPTDEIAPASSYRRQVITTERLEK